MQKASAMRNLVFVLGVIPMLLALLAASALLGATVLGMWKVWK